MGLTGYSDLDAELGTELPPGLTVFIGPKACGQRLIARVALEHMGEPPSSYLDLSNWFPRNLHRQPTSYILKDVEHLLDSYSRGQKIMIVAEGQLIQDDDFLKSLKLINSHARRRGYAALLTYEADLESVETKIRLVSKADQVEVVIRFFESGFPTVVWRMPRTQVIRFC